MERVTTIAFVAVLLTASVASAAAVGASGTGTSAATADGAQSGTYAGSHVSFQTSGSAVTNYTVGGTELFASASTQPQSESESQSGISAGLSLSAVTNLTGAALSLETSAQTRAEVESESGATITAHDSERGILTVNAGQQAQYAEFGLSSDAEVAEESDGRVVVESGNRTGTFVVAGEGQATVNDDGNVAAELEQNATLVFRSYEDERAEADREQDRLIAEGTATAEVYVDQQDGSRVADVATYGEDVTVETSNEAESTVNMTVERATSEGTVVITTVSEGAIATAENADDVSVTIDGEAAVAASSYSELEGGIGEEPRYMVRQSGEASASADVLVAVDHFSEREVAMESADDGSGSSGGSSGDDGPSDGDDGGTGSGMPGFGPIAALLALLSAAGIRLRN